MEQSGHVPDDLIKAAEEITPGEGAYLDESGSFNPEKVAEAIDLEALNEQVEEREKNKKQALHRAKQEIVHLPTGEQTTLLNLILKATFKGYTGSEVTLFARSLFDREYHPDDLRFLAEAIETTHLDNLASINQSAKEELDRFYNKISDNTYPGADKETERLRERVKGTEIEFQKARTAAPRAAKIINELADYIEKNGPTD